jgi:hypothetical protein
MALLLLLYCLLPLQCSFIPPWQLYAGEPLCRLCFSFA